VAAAPPALPGNQRVEVETAGKGVEGEAWCSPRWVKEGMPRRCLRVAERRPEAEAWRPSAAASRRVRRRGAPS
jgi:hypothetical protein